MAATTVPERPETAEAPPAAPPRPAMFSAAGYAIVAIIMLLEIPLVYMAFRFMGGAGSHEEKPSPVITRKYTEVDLGQFRVDLAPTDPTSALADAFMVRVVLVLNHKEEHIEELKASVDGLKNKLKDTLSTRIILQKTDADLRKANVLETLRGEIREKVNRDLGMSKGGHEVIEEVIFPESRLPARR